MAKDLIVRRNEGILTLVHDEPGLAIDSLVVRESGLFARSDLGSIPVGSLTVALKQDLDFCDRCIVVELDGDRVSRTSEARLIKEL